MNLRFFAALISAILPLGVLAQQPMVVDNAHSQVGVPPGKTAAVYTLRPGSQILVDASKYEFKASGAGPANSANSLQLVLGKEMQYSVPWDSTRKTVVISAQTAQPNGTSKPFGGFEVGQKVVVAIGKLDGPNFNVMWVGMADIK